MAFDLYFAGISYPEVLDLALELPVHKLYSQLTERKGIKQWVAAVRAGETAGKLFIDSGAYTAHTKGTALNVDGYIDYLNARTDAITLAAQVDTIPGTYGTSPSKEEVEYAPEESFRNYLYMRERMDEPDKLLPVFHQDEDMKWLENLLDWRDPVTGRPIPYIGLSGRKDRPAKHRYAWYRRCFTVIEQSSNPKVMTHCFGSFHPEHLEQFPWTSADATSWIRPAAFGNIVTAHGAIAVSDIKQNWVGHITQDKQLLEVVKKDVEALGFQLEELMSDGDHGQANIKRAMYNMKYFARWASNYRYKGPKRFAKKGLF